ncbi:MAG: hypothetical protein QF805_30390, partial [Pirellulaceae bacterium]|nr:hypothetical protein [Pirellulaceae bacterium]
LLALGGAVLLIGYRSAGWQVQNAGWLLAIGGLGGLLIALLISRRSARDSRWLAGRIEERHPSLNQLLVTAVEQTPNEGRMTYLQETVIRDAMFHGHRYNWTAVVSRGRLLLGHVVTVLSLLLLGCVSVTLAWLPAPAELSARAAADPIDVKLGLQYELKVEPGDTEIEKGKSLLVLAEFSNALPPSSTLVYETESGQQQVPMRKSFDNPLFVARVPLVEQPFDYHIEFGDEQQSDSYHVGVYEMPELTQADARIEFPEYVGKEPLVVQDVRQVTAVEGSRLRLICRVNKPMATAKLVDRDGVEIALTADPDDELAYIAEWTLVQSQRFEVQLSDEAERTNDPPPEIVVNVTRNQPPKLKLAFPLRDLQVSPIEEVELQAKLWDDFGIQRYGLSYTLAGTEPEDVVLGDKAQPRREHLADYLLELEALGLAPDQLVTYHFWAEDHGPDGEVRRTASDMYFAEVRPFEE